MAPIALCPDTLLTQIMMASTFPVEMMQARLWLDNAANQALKGNAIAKALETQSWDPSVKSPVPFPQIVGMMTDKADWMQQFGYAVSVQQMAVLDSVQRLRRQAQLAGSLATTPQQTVTMTASSQSGALPVIVVQPANPRVVCVPSYNPTQVYDAWPYPATPQVYLPPPGYAIGSALVTGMAFPAGVAVESTGLTPLENLALIVRTFLAAQAVRRRGTLVPSFSIPLFSVTLFSVPLFSFRPRNVRRRRPWVA